MAGSPASRLRLLAALLLAAAPARSHTPPVGVPKGVPLPAGLVPTHYALTLRPYLDNGRFQGRVRINVTCREATRAVFLHAHETLHISHEDVRVWRLTDDGRELLAVASTKKDSIRQHYAIFLTRNLTEGARYEVQMSFSGQLAHGRPEGFFADSYELHRTKERRPFAATQMWPQHARRVFPCFDEPQFKASFDISVVRPARMAAVSNMPVRLSDKMPNEPAWQVDHFQTTPPMATLSLAVVVSDLGYISPPGPAASGGGAEEGPRVRVFGRAHLLGRLQEAADAAPAALDFLQDYLAAPFPLPKLDLVVLPHFTASAPANMWGVVLFREEDLVGDAMPLHMASELAYQWLRHLATPLARSAEAVHLQRALVGFLQAARLQGSAPDFSAGAAATKDHSLYYEYSRRHPYALVQAQKETLRIMKTQWVLRMLNYTLTERSFREGLRDFLREKRGSSWTDTDVWEALERRGWQDGTLPRSVQLLKATRSWLVRDRFPVLSVTRNYADGSAEVEQHVFLRERPRPAADRALLWFVPVPLLTQDGLQPQALRTAAWLREQRSVSVRGLPGPERFIVVNPNEIGMFMVNYDATNWRLLSDFLLRPAAARQLDTGTRAKLLHDAWNLALAGELRPGVALNLTLALRHETEFAVWDAFFGMADHLGRQVRGTRAGEKFQAYVCLLTEPLVERLRLRPGAPEPRDDSARADPEVSLRALARFAACTAGCDGCRAEAQDEFQRWLNLPDPEEGNPVSDIFLCPVLAHGPADQWEFVLQRLLNFPEEREREERAMLLAKLADCTAAPDRVRRLLDAALLEPASNFTDADLRQLFGSLSANGAAVPTLFGFFVQHWDRVRERCRGRPGLWEFLLSRALRFKTQQGLALVSELLVARSGQLGPAEAVADEALRTIKEEAQWSAQSLPEMESWLDAHLPSSEPSPEPSSSAGPDEEPSSSSEPPTTPTSPFSDYE